MKINSIPKSGRKGSVVYFKGRYGYVARQLVSPRNPRTAEQLLHRGNVRAVSIRWPTLAPEQRTVWCVGAAGRDFISKTGRPVRLNGCNFFVSLNTRRADLDLPQFDLPPAEPVFSPNPVAELVITNTGGKITLKLRVPSPPAQYTLVQGASASQNGCSLRATFPLPGAAARPERRLERHYRALRCPVWRAEIRAGHLDSDLPAH